MTFAAQSRIMVPRAHGGDRRPGGAPGLQNQCGAQQSPGWVRFPFTSGRRRSGDPESKRVAAVLFKRSQVGILEIGRRIQGGCQGGRSRQCRSIVDTGQRRQAAGRLVQSQKTYLRPLSRIRFLASPPSDAGGGYLPQPNFVPRDPNLSVPGLRSSAASPAAPTSAQIAGPL